MILNADRQEIPVEKTVASKISADDQEISDEKTVAPAPKRTDEKMAPKVDITTCPFCGGDLKNMVTTHYRSSYQNCQLHRVNFKYFNVK